MKNSRQCYYHYPKDKNGKYTKHTICMLVKDGSIYHGESLCSEKDQFVKSIGRKLAHKRALEAYNNRNKKTSKVKSKIKIAHYNTTSCHEPYCLKTKCFSNKPNDTKIEIWASEKDKTWTKKALKDCNLQLHSNGDNVVLNFKNGNSITLDFCELTDLKLALYAYNKKVNKFSKFKPKRIK